MRVAFFGGSFNPPHVGHVLAASYALSVGFDKVLVVVVSTHAFAKQLASFEHRAEMARLAFSPLKGVEISTIERTLPSPNYTVTTLRALTSAHPSWRFSLLIGSDVLPELDRWHEPDEVRRLAPPFILDRAGHAQLAENLASPPNVLPEVSSSEARDQVALAAAGTDAARARAWLEQYLPARVLGYIDQQHLYR